MKKTLSVLAIAATISFASCSNPLNKEFNKDTFVEDAKAIGESKKLNEDDAKLLGKYIMFSGAELEGKTYGEILEEAKAKKKEEEELAAKAKKEEEERRARLGSALTVAMFDKGYEEQGFQDYLTYGIAFENKTDKDIKAVRGTLVITDLFDEVITRVGITADDGIPAHETVKAVYNTDYNQFMEEDKLMRSKEMSDIKVNWNPEKIIFADGTTLE